MVDNFFLGKVRNNHILRYGGLVVWFAPESRSPYAYRLLTAPSIFIDSEIHRRIPYGNRFLDCVIVKQTPEDFEVGLYEAFRSAFLASTIRRLCA